MLPFEAVLFKTISQVKFKFVYGPGALKKKVTDFTTIYRISVGKMALMFSFYFNFNINVLANILAINKCIHIIATNSSKVYCWIFG